MTWTATSRWPVATVWLVVSCNCSGRVVPEAEEDTEDFATEAERLCRENLDWAWRCAEEQGEPLSSDDYEESLETCLNAYFKEELTLCREEAILAVSCRANLSCDDYPQPPCTDAEYPLSVCAQDPQGWAAAGCNASKCPGECCQAAEQ